jgi:Pilus formation protein N terminal region
MRNASRRPLAFAAFLFSATVAAVGPSLAGQPLVVEVDQSQMVVLPATPGSIVIGNPTFADASIEGNKLFIHGKGFGTTNMMIMDMDGNQMAAFDISVSHVTNNAVALYKGPARISYDCAPLCEANLQTGDEFTHFVNLASQVQKKMEFSTGTTSAKSEAPPAPQ